MEENKIENIINIIKDMDIKDKLKLGICLSTSDFGLKSCTIKLNCTKSLIQC